MKKNIFWSYLLLSIIYQINCNRNSRWPNYFLLFHSLCLTGTGLTRSISSSPSYRLQLTWKIRDNNQWINLPLFSTVLPSNSRLWPFSTGLVDVEVTSVSWLGPTGQKQLLFDGKTVENKGKLILKYIMFLHWWEDFS